jgi:hypothetical protein
MRRTGTRARQQPAGRSLTAEFPCANARAVDFECVAVDDAGLSGARYGLPAPVFHRLDHASLPGAQAIHASAAAR